MGIFFLAGGESAFIVLVSGKSYATNGASDIDVKPPKGLGCTHFGTIYRRTYSVVWVQSYKVGPATTKQAKAIIFRENHQ